MKTLLIYPDLNIDPGWQGQYQEGIASISAILKSRGYYVELAHVYNLAKGKDILNRVSAGFDLVAFSSTTTMFPFVQHYSRLIKKHFKNVPLLCGGPHATSAPHQLLENSDIDYVCVGEGEYFILDLLDYLRGSGNKGDIKNLAYRNEADEIVINELRSPIDPLDELPFSDRGLFDFQHKNNNVAYISAGRGCPNRCAYCSNDHLNKIYKNKYLRFRKPQTVIREIELILEKYPSIKRLLFLDDVFTLYKDWLADFCGKYSSLFKLPFTALAHPAAITEEKIKILKEAGCNEIGFGIQSGNEFIRNNIMLRRVSNNKIKESVRILEKYKMKFMGDIIFGVPSEQKKHMIDTIKICAENNVKAKSHIFYPLPATRLEQLAVEKGLFKRSVYGEDYHSKTILDYSKLYKARVLFFHRYCRHLIRIYRILGYSLSGSFLRNVRLCLLDKTVCSDFVICITMSMRSAFINLCSFIRKNRGVSEYRLARLSELQSDLPTIIVPPPELES